MVVSQIAKNYVGRSRESANTVIGSALGAYLAFALVQRGIAQGSYFHLFMLLFFVSGFSGFITGISDHLFDDQPSWGWIFTSFFCMIFLATGATYLASELGLDYRLMLTILGAWFVIVGLDTLSMFLGYRLIMRRTRHD